MSTAKHNTQRRLRVLGAALTTISLSLCACARDPAYEMSPPPADRASVGQHVPGEVIVQFRAGTSNDEIAAILNVTGTRIAKDLGMPLAYLFKFSSDIPVDEMIRRLKNYPAVTSVEANRIIRLEPPVPTEPKKPRLNRD